MRLHRKIDPFLFLVLPLSAYLVVVLIPIFASVYYSVMNWNGIREITFAGLDNFAKLFSDRNLRTVLGNTVIYSGISTVCQIGFGLCLAILVRQVKKNQNLVRVLLFTPTVISGVAMSQTFKNILSISPDGPVNALLGAIGLEHLRTAFLAHGTITLPVLALVDSFRYCGLYMVVFYAAFASLDASVSESALIDGASNWQKLIYVQLPMMRKIIINSVVLVLIGTFKGFEGSYIMTNGGPGYASELMATYMYKTTFTSMDYGYGSVLGLIIALSCVVLFSLVNVLTRQKD